MDGNLVKILFKNILMPVRILVNNAAALYFRLLRYHGEDEWVKF